MIMLHRREVDFLHKSNAIEHIVNIDYRDPRNVSVDGGHVAAYVDAQDRARCRVGLRGAEVGRWQRWIVEEQIAYGHAAAPARAEVPAVVRDVLVDVNAQLAGAARHAPEAALAIIGELMCRFAAMAFEAKGRTARLVASHVATWCGLPLLEALYVPGRAVVRAHSGWAATKPSP
jgi:hypothetical protein